METEVKQRILRTQWGEHARSILRQFNEAGYSDYLFRGPHYVIYDRGEFRLYPFGLRSAWRYSFECRPESSLSETELLWTFMVRQ